LTVDGWEPAQYERFKAERRLAFDDLLAMVDPVPGGRVVDLGCGSGELTVELHRYTRAAETLGIDSSAAMLEGAGALAGDGLRFEHGDIAAFDPTEPMDVVFANASLQWVPDHPALLARLRDALAPHGQLAVQVPANVDHPSHVVATEVAREFGVEPGDREGAVLGPERYAELLHDLGFEGQHVRLQVYLHVLGSTTDVVEWVKGTRLTEVRAAIADDERYHEFIGRYRARLLQVLGERSPYPYAYKRILLWGQR
jgi:trans-aconitate 2-methyltransferase